MHPVNFPQANGSFGADQEEYITLPGYSNSATEHAKVITCWKLSLRERLKILFSGVIWMSILTFGGKLQPQRLDVSSPFDKGKG